MPRRTDEARGRGFFPSLRSSSFRIYFTGGLVSNVGVWMQRTAQAWVVLQLSGSSGAVLGVATLLQFLPVLLFGTVAGALGDRFDKLKILIVTQTLIGVISIAMIALELTHNLQLWIVMTLISLLGVVTAFDVPPRQSIVSELVARDDVVNAVGLNSASFNVARLVGPSLAGLMIFAGPTWPVFAVHALSCVAIVCSLAILIRRRTSPRPPQPRVPGQIRAGLSYIRRSPVLVSFLVIGGLVGAVGGNSMQVLIPLVTVGSFGGSAVDFGLMTGALALGSLVGGLVTGVRRGVPPPGQLFFTAMALGVAQIITAFMPNMIAFAIALLACGFLFMAFVVAANSSVQLRAEPAMRNRVMAAYLMFFLGGGSLGAPAIGLATELIGPLPTFAAAGAVSLLAGAMCAVGLRRALRGMDDPTNSSAAPTPFTFLPHHESHQEGPHMTDPRSETIVDGFLAAASLTVSPQERSTFVRDYPVVRAAVDALYDIDGAELAISNDPLSYYSPR